MSTPRPLEASRPREEEPAIPFPLSSEPCLGDRAGPLEAGVGCRGTDKQAVRVFVELGAGEQMHSRMVGQPFSSHSGLHPVSGGATDTCGDSPALSSPLPLTGPREELHYLGHTHTKKIFPGYLKFRFNWESCYI